MVAFVNDILTNSQVRRRSHRRAALFELGAAAVRTLALWQRRIREGRQLAQLSARELQDIGLTTADVHAVLSKPFWHD